MGVALVTGGGRGIGAAVSLKLARDGYDVMLTYNTSSKSAELVVEEIRAMGRMLSPSIVIVRIRVKLH